jgi:hypothetical protein
MSPLLYYFYDLQRDITNIVAIGATPAPEGTVAAIRGLTFTDSFTVETVATFTALRYFNYNIISIYVIAARYGNYDLNLPVQTMRTCAYTTLT